MTRGRKSNLVVEETQAALVVMDELVVDLVLGRAKLLHRALEISSRDVVVAKHLAAAGNDDLLVLHGILLEPFRGDLVTECLLLALAELLADLVLVLVESPLGNAVSRSECRSLCRVHLVREDNGSDREHSYSNRRNIKRPHEFD